MNLPDLLSLTTAQLLEQFRVLALAKGAASLERRIARHNRLYRQLEAVKAELKARSGDQRRGLAQFYHHPDPQVRLDAALATLAIFPERAQAVLQTIIDRSDFPQVANAMHALMNIRDGTRIPE